VLVLRQMDECPFGLPASRRVVKMCQRIQCLIERNAPGTNQTPWYRSRSSKAGWMPPAATFAAHIDPAVSGWNEIWHKASDAVVLSSWRIAAAQG